MSFVLRKRQFSQQPQYPAPIDQGNRFGEKVSLVCLPTGYRGLIGKKTLPFTTDKTARTPTPSGVAMTSFDAANTHAKTDNQAIFSGSAVSCFSIWRLHTTPNGGYQDIVRKDGDFTPLQYASTLLFGSIWTNVGLYSSSSTVIAVNTEYRSLTRWSAATNLLEVIASPGNAGTVATSGTSISPYSGTPLCFGAAESGGETSGVHNILTVFFDNWINDSEYRALRDDPWQIFKAPPRRLWAISGTAPSGAIIPVFINHYRNQGIM